MSLESEVDPVLVLQVRIAERYPGLGVTLVLPGAVVCGLLIWENECAATADHLMADASERVNSFPWGDQLQKMVALAEPGRRRHSQGPRIRSPS